MGPKPGRTAPNGYLPICAVPIKTFIYNGLFSIIVLLAETLNAPLTDPLTPSPAIALPVYNATLFGATLRALNVIMCSLVLEETLQ